MYVGSPIDDLPILDRLPALLREFLLRTNGYVAFHGGLHVRGACLEPEWHSLRAAWTGEHALHRLFPALRPDDVPLAEDALGDQFVLRDGTVHRLWAESGEIESMGVNLAGFDAAVRADPVGYLSLGPLERFRADGGVLEPGQLLSAYPPFVMREAGDVSLRAISSRDRILWLADLASRLQALPDGARVEFHVEADPDPLHRSSPRVHP